MALPTLASHKAPTMTETPWLTPRSSFTAVDSRPMSPTEREAIQDEDLFERYGGDAPLPPPEKSAPIVEAPKPDPNQVEWDGPSDAENPQNWTNRRRWIVTVICCIMTINVTFASSAPSSATRQIAHEFGVSAEVSYLITSLFLLGYCFGPLLWGPGSELIGRRPILCIPMTIYSVLILGQAYAKNIETLLVTRFLSGLFGVAPLIVSGGLISDMWDAEGRGKSSSLFTACVFLGPVLGPIVASFITVSPLGWRWVFKVMAIFAGTCTLIVIVALPETYSPVLLKKKADRMRKEEALARKGTPEENTPSLIFAEHETQDWSFRGLIERTIFRPFIMLRSEPILVLVTLYMSLVYGVLYCLFQAFPVVFAVKRTLTPTQVGLQFIGVGIGTTLGAVLNLFFTRHYPALIKKWKGFPPPEERLFGAMLGAPALVVGIFWLGWTGQFPSIPWYVPAISTVLVGFAISLIFISFISYLIDVYLMYSASALSANTVVRSAVAAAFPLFTTQMFTGLGVGWACTLLGLISLVLAPSPFLFYKYGPRVRGGSKFAPCIDLRIAKELEEEDLARKEKEVSV